MAIAEYMLHRNEQGNKIVPSFIIDGGHWWNPVDHTMVGWIEDVRDYYIPDTLVILTREKFADRLLALHAVSPFYADRDGLLNVENPPVAMSEQQVIEMANYWYDKFNSTHSGS